MPKRKKRSNIISDMPINSNSNCSHVDQKEVYVQFNILYVCDMASTCDFHYMRVMIVWRKQWCWSLLLEHVKKPHIPRHAADVSRKLHMSDMISGCRPQMTRLKPELLLRPSCNRGGSSSCKEFLSSSSHFRESLTSMVGEAHEQWLCSDQTPFARMEGSERGWHSCVTFAQCH